MKRMLAVFALSGAMAHAAEIKEVRFESLDGFGGRIEAQARCQTKVGDEYDAATVAGDVRALRASGEYQDISADASQSPDGKMTVVFSLHRKMRFHGPLVVEGNNFFRASKIASEAGFKDGRLYSEGDLRDAAAKVREMYVKKNWVRAKIETKVRAMPGGNNCNFVFIIDEGTRFNVSGYEFDGAETVDPGDLRGAIGVYPWWNPYSWFTDKPITREQLAQAVNKLEEYYADLGYLDAKVSGPEYVEDGEGGGTLRFDVSEGPLYKVGICRIEGVTKYRAEDVAAMSSLPEEGSVAGAKALSEAAHRIEVAVGSGDSGLAGSSVDIRRIPREDDPSIVDLVFKVTEGVRAVINQVRIEGNDYTKDKVIRREIPLSPGNRMLADRAEMGKNRLENLRYFSRVRYYLRDSDRGKDESGAEYRDLVYEVEERNTGNFMVGVGASSVDSVFVSAEVQQSNFDIFAPSKLFRGGGQKGRLYVAAGPRIQTYEASVTEPWLFDRQLEFTVEGYRRQRWYDEYDVIRSGASVSLAYPVKFHPDWKPFGSFGVRLSGEFIEFDDPEHGYWQFGRKTVSLAERGGEDDRYGDAFEAVARIFWSRDTRNSFQFPSSGTRSRLFLDFAGGDNEYWRLGFNHRNYFTVWKRYNHVLMASIRAETIDAFSDDVPIYNRMFLGGPKSIRGIEYRHVSPMARKRRGRDPDGDLSGTYTPWGGQTLVCANFEYTVPIVKMLRLAAFTDLGSVGEDEFDLDMSDTFAWTAGIGVRLDIPMFPIRLDFGSPLKKPDHADKEVFSFTVGYDF